MSSAFTFEESLNTFSGDDAHAMKKWIVLLFCDNFQVERLATAGECEEVIERYRETVFAYSNSKIHLLNGAWHRR